MGEGGAGPADKEPDHAPIGPALESFRAMVRHDMLLSIREHEGRACRQGKAAPDRVTPEG